MASKVATTDTGIGFTVLLSLIVLAGAFVMYFWGGQELAGWGYALAIAVAAVAVAVPHVWNR